MPRSRSFRLRPACDLVSAGELRLEELDPRDTPAFLPLPTFTAGIISPTVLAAGDFNGDGLADVAVGNASEGAVSVGIALGDGRGGFTAAPSVTDPQLSFPRVIVVADFDGDGDADLAVGSADPVSPIGRSLLVFPGNGDGTFGAPTFQFPVPTRAIAVGDFTGDAILDLVTADAAQGGYRVFAGTGVGTFVPLGLFQPAQLDADRLAVADFDGDGKLDFVGSDIGGQRLFFFYGNGNGTFVPQAVMTGGDGVDLVAADYDGDGRVDVVQCGDSGTIFIRNLGARQFDTGVIVSPSGQFDSRLATADVDRNGLPDVIGVNPFEAHVYLSQGGGAFAQDPAGPYPLAGSSFQADVTVADIDADGNTDFVVSRADAMALTGDGQVFLNLAPEFTQTTVASDPNPSLVGQTVTLTATVTPLVPPFPPAGPPSGTVTFVVDGTTLGAVPLVNGTASITVSRLTVGTHQVVASYSGDTAFRQSGSGPVPQVVNAIPIPGPTSRTYTFIVTGLPTVPGAGADRVAVGSFNGDDLPDIVLGAGPGRPAVVTVLDGETRQPIAEVTPFGGAFVGGVFVTAGDVDGDGVADLAVVADQGGGPRARVYLTRGNQLIPAVDFFALDPGFRGGLRAALGDVNHDGFADLVVTGGPGAGPRVAVYDGRSLLPELTPIRLVNDFFALDPDLRTGLNVAIGDLNGDGFAEIVVGADTGGAPRLAVYDGGSVVGNAPRELADFFSGPTTDRGGVRVAVRDVGGDGFAELITGGGPGSAAMVRVYSGLGLYLSPAPSPLFETEPFPGLTAGVYVA